MLFLRVANALIIKSAFDDSFIGKPKQNKLVVVEKLSMGEDLLLGPTIKGSDDETLLAIKMKKDYYMGFGRKSANNKAQMNGTTWNLPMFNYKIYLTDKLNFGIEIYDDKNKKTGKCMGIGPEKTAFKVGTCNNNPEFNNEFSFTLKDTDKLKRVSRQTLKFIMDKEDDKSSEDDEIELIKLEPVF